MKGIGFFIRIGMLALGLLGANPGLLLFGLRDTTGSVFLSVAAVSLCSCLWLVINIFPCVYQKDTGVRLWIMRGGRTLCFLAIIGLALQGGILLWAYPRFLAGGISVPVLVVNSIISVLSWLIMLWNGIIRIFCTSRRLSIKTRVLMLLFMWIPLVNLVVLLYALRLVHGEYDFACYKESVRAVRAQSDICRTRFPLIMVHGIGFRDLKYFNYWGRIPRELMRYGADVYYGNQEALGTIVNNGEDIKKKILEVIEQTGCEKVNIIAHSKGGLDARYVITKMGMGELVASLTTICTPHRGCRFVDYACRLPEGLYRFVAKCFDRSFLKIGDKNPDFYTATRQFSTQWSQSFNEAVPDDPGVYYQSYASIMKNAFSDILLTLPYCFIKPLEGANDGLVSISSATWGEFRGVISNRYRRGISHADMIDLKREDYKGVDIVESYVEIVSDLKNKGF